MQFQPSSSKGKDFAQKKLARIGPKFGPQVKLALGSVGMKNQVCGLRRLDVMIV